MASPEVTFPQPVQFGRRQDDSFWISFGVPLKEHLAFDWPGSPKQAADLAQQVNAIPLLVAAIKAVRADVRDPDTDTFISGASAEKLDEALAAVGVRP